MPNTMSGALTSTQSSEVVLGEGGKGVSLNMVVFSLILTCFVFFWEGGQEKYGREQNHEYPRAHKVCSI